MSGVEVRLGLRRKNGTNALLLGRSGGFGACGISSRVPGRFEGAGHSVHSVFSVGDPIRHTTNAAGGNITGFAVILSELVDGGIMQVDNEKIDEAILALLYLTLHDRARAWIEGAGPFH